MLEEQIKKDYVQALKDKNSVKSSTLTLLRSQMKYEMINHKIDQLKDDQIIPIIKKQIKQRKDSIEQFEKGGRQDLVDKEAAELVILKEYLPEEMSQQEIESLVEEAIKEADGQSIKDMGKVMKAVMPKVGQRADGQLVSQAVKTKLSAL